MVNGILLFNYDNGFRLSLWVLVEVVVAVQSVPGWGPSTMAAAAGRFRSNLFCLFMMLIIYLITIKKLSAVNYTIIYYCSSTNNIVIKLNRLYNF